MGISLTSEETWMLDQEYAKAYGKDSTGSIIYRNFEYAKHGD